LIKYDLLKFKA